MNDSPEECSGIQIADATALIIKVTLWAQQLCSESDQFEGDHTKILERKE